MFQNSILKLTLLLLLTILFSQNSIAQNNNELYKEEHRPQIHFSPKAHWMNDPNGMIYTNGIYHLFFQYYPDATVWGPMHWGHATSKDLIHWVEQPIALYPDSLGYIFSGSVVVDKNNTTGFGKNGIAPLIAIFTHHNMDGEKAKRNDFQNQSIAYSIDDGKSWLKYNGNPVLKNPGIVDFRDPKVMWYEPEKKWIMTLATKDRVTFYSSLNLKNWTKESEFGSTLGAHGGVWECPDLFMLNDNGKKVWVLSVSIGSGGPNGGSATQYFTGDFDGAKFTTTQTSTKWIDYGSDNYAGVTWSNTGDRKIFLGWMSNWIYATQVPTEKWRSAMTIPRDLKLIRVSEELFVASTAVKSLSDISKKEFSKENFKVEKNFSFTANNEIINFPCKINLKLNKRESFSFKIFNNIGEEIIIGFDKNSNNYYVDRIKSGKIFFNKDFAAKHTAPVLTKSNSLDLELIIDISSVELFADGGLTNMTEIFFPTKIFDKINLQTGENFLVKKLTLTHLKSVH